MTDFVDVDAEVDAQAIGDSGVDALQLIFAANGFPDWTANDAALEIILLYVIAQWAADCAQLAAQARLAIFRAFGTKLLELPYEGGTIAGAVSTWSLTATGQTIPGGTFVTVADHGFYVVDDIFVASTAATGVQLAAVESGTDYNDLSGPVELVDQIDWVSSVTLAGPSSGGTDQETDDDYTVRLAEQLALQAPRPITAADFATMARSVPQALLPAGSVVGRTTAIDGFNPGANTFTAHIQTGSPNVTGISSLTGVTAGSLISGTGVPASTYLLSVNSAAASGVLSQNATTSATETLTATGSYANERCVTVFVTDADGNALTSAARAAIQTWLAGFRELNFLVFVEAPSYNTIYVTAEIHALPGYDQAALVAAVKDALLTYLSPAQWGNPLYVTTPDGTAAQWLNSGDGFNVVRYNKLVAVIERVLGVDYVPPGAAGLAVGTAAAPSGTADITMVGPAPLPQADITTPTIVITAV